MYTRRTARGFQDVMDWCTRTATRALASGVSATSPSIPAVLRPVLRCVTCRTLTSVQARLRSMSFCRFLTLGQSCSCDAVKIRCRSRRTCSSCARQSILSHWTGASRGWSSGPFTIRAAVTVTSATAGTTHWPPSHTGVVKLYPVIASNLPFGSGGLGRLASPAHLPHVSALSRPGTRPGIRPVMQRPRREDRA
jgi:hypothetical protein